MMKNNNNNNNNRLFVKFMAFALAALMIASVVFVVVGFVQMGQTPPAA